MSAVVLAVVGAVVNAIIQPGAQRISGAVNGAHTPSLSVTVSYGSPIQLGSVVALPADTSIVLPSVLSDWGDQPGPVTQRILAAGPANIGQNDIVITLQNPAGHDTAEVVGITAKILSTAAPYSGPLFIFPNQGGGESPVIALDLDSASPDARTWDIASQTIGPNYFQAGNYINVDGGSSQDVKVVALARRAEYTYKVQITILQDGRTKQFLLTADNQGTPFRVTGAAVSYKVLYYSRYQYTGTGNLNDVNQAPWSPCTTPGDPTVPDCRVRAIVFPIHH